MAKKKVGIVMNEETIKRLKIASFHEGTTISGFIERAIKEYLGSKGNGQQTYVSLESTFGIFRLERSEKDTILNSGSWFEAE